MTNECTNCGDGYQPTPDKQDELYEHRTSPEFADFCDRCIVSGLEHGHAHGMHTDQDCFPEFVPGCPSCWTTVRPGVIVQWADVAAGSGGWWTGAVARLYRDLDGNAMAVVVVRREGKRRRVRLAVARLVTDGTLATAPRRTAPWEV